MQFSSSACAVALLAFSSSSPSSVVVTAFSSFAPSSTTARTSTALNIVVGDTKEEFAIRLEQTFAKAAATDPIFEELVQAKFPGAMTNRDFVTKATDVLRSKGFNGANTLLATSLCCDELARQLEDDFNGIYGTNFNLGGLAGFPFAGNTGFGAMSGHIPDDGYCLIVYGPHVGITEDGTVGKVERSGIDLVDGCCGSALAASSYVDSINKGFAPTINIQTFTDFQQNAVRELILPHGKRLADAGDKRMVELPYALYDSQKMLLEEIITAGSTGIKRGIAVLGGVQINTGPQTPDYFVPLQFDYINYRGEVVDSMLDSLVPPSPAAAADDDDDDDDKE
mmetsp:Transcript_27397/g.29582  ORF Transcript_27397/g.29582 Transcript_27397/m.29582 type:complete len:338 (+) Transcript_27397:185-1198(+)